MIQIQEVKERLAQDYPYEPPTQNKEEDTAATELLNPQLLSKKGQDRLNQAVQNNLGPLQPYHLREARQQMIRNEECIPSQPRSMFRKK